jgi:hypothetical protein
MGTHEFANGTRNLTPAFRLSRVAKVDASNEFFARVRLLQEHATETPSDQERLHSPLRGL